MSLVGIWVASQPREKRAYSILCVTGAKETATVSANRGRPRPRSSGNLTASAVRGRSDDRIQVHIDVRGLPSRHINDLAIPFQVLA
jgi:hypothetical protein